MEGYFEIDKDCSEWQQNN